MRAWSGERGAADGMGASVTRAASEAGSAPPLKNGSELRAAGYLVAVGSRTARFRRRHQNKVLRVGLLALLLVLLCLVVAMSVLYASARRGGGPARVCVSRECMRSAANLALSIDPTADPCEDFYQFSCGRWAAEHPRPDALHSFDWFRDKQARVYAAVRDVLAANDSRAASAGAGAGEGAPRPLAQARTLYRACLDTDTLDKRGLKPAIAVLESLGLPAAPGLLNVSDEGGGGGGEPPLDWLAVAVAAKTRLGMDLLVGFDLFTDPRDSSRYRLVLGSPETTDPFPSMYNEKKRPSSRRSVSRRQPRGQGRRGAGVDDGGDEEALRARAMTLYYGQLLKMFAVEGGAGGAGPELDAAALDAAEQVYSLDTELYELESPNNTDSDEDLYQPIPEYSPAALEAATGAGAGLWARYLLGVFNGSRVTLDWAQDTVLVAEPDRRYLAALLARVHDTPAPLLQLYLWTKVVEVMAVHTTSEVRALAARAQQAARGGGGAGGQASRSLLCADVATELLGLAVAHAIVDPHFLNDTKPKIEKMIQEIKNALSSLVARARWMDDDTKLATFEKIIEMRSLVGFPAWLLHEGALEAYYEGVEVAPDTHLENLVNVVQAKVRKALGRLRQRNNGTWATDPTEVNAYHTFQENTITVPLVMLQYPFYDLGLDSLNYGSLGTILGHEITHGFDNFGRHFDKRGNLVPWWSNATVAAFLNVTQCFVRQYDQYYLPELGEHVDGRRTLGENIADAGGLREALAALHRHRRGAPPAPRLPGFERYTDEQLFFLSYGNLWCGVWTREALAADARDEHAPQRLRAAAALRNSPDFARAFRCRPGAAMNPPARDRCIVF